MIRILLICLLPFFAQGQNGFQGNWKTTVDGLEMFVKFDVPASMAYITVPAQGVLNMSASNAEFTEDRVDFYFQSFGATYIGHISKDTIKGNWKQNGTEKQVDFLKYTGDLSFKRPQEPKEPFGYQVEEINFKSSKDQKSLSGSLTIPVDSTKRPAVLLISGSGPQDRDEFIFGHKPFAVIADHLTKNGFVVLRYDERGVGKSSGSYIGSTTESLSIDAESAFNYLASRKEVDASKVGIIGHSEGSLIAAMIASRNSDVDFIVSLAGPGLRGSDIMDYQLKQQYAKTNISNAGLIKMESFLEQSIKLSAKDVPNDVILDELKSNSSKFFSTLSFKDKNALGTSEERFYFSMAPLFLDPWMRYFLQSNPADYWSKVKVPTLALNGTKDAQVLYKPNLKIIKSSLKKAGNKDFKVKKMKKFNHLFQKTSFSDGSEYMTISTTFDPIVLDYMTVWLKKR